MKKKILTIWLLIMCILVIVISIISITQAKIIHELYKQSKKIDDIQLIIELEDNRTENILLSDLNKNNYKIKRVIGFIPVTEVK